MDMEEKAWRMLFIAIIHENGYYDKLRYFAKKRNYGLNDFAIALYFGFEKCPDGMSPYFYLDSLEDMLIDHSIRGFNDVCDMIEYVYDHELWKDC